MTDQAQNTTHGTRHKHTTDEIQHTELDTRVSLHDTRRITLRLQTPETTHDIRHKAEICDPRHTKHYTRISSIGTRHTSHVKRPCTHGTQISTRNRRRIILAHDTRVTATANRPRSTLHTTHDATHVTPHTSKDTQNTTSYM